MYIGGGEKKPMILAREGSPTTIEPLPIRRTRYKISQSKAMFETLSSRLYTDKIRAIIRELSCNAYDAHVMAGIKDVPFELHLPTTFEPYFSINDFGTGMEYIDPCPRCAGSGTVMLKGQQVGCEQCFSTGVYDAVISLFATYFSSDKNSSNEVIGALGLGSKSPFCYTAAKYRKSGAGFDVINRYHGMTRIYSAFLNEEGEPEIALRHELVTPSATNGVEVKFQVELNDIWEFENKAKVALEFFDPVPNINIEGFDVPKPEYSIKTERWGMRENIDTPQGSKLRAIQGMVQYAVGNIDISRLTEAQMAICRMPLDIFAPIGTLDPHVSRESLEMNDRTIDNILTLLDEVHTSLLEEVRKKVDACKTAHEARLLIHELTLAPGMGRLVNDAFNRGLLFGDYTNFSLATKEAVINELDVRNVQMYEVGWKENAVAGGWRARGSRTVEKWHKTEMFAPTSSRDYKLKHVLSGELDKSTYDVTLQLKEKTTFIINDTKRSAVKWVKLWMVAQSHKQAFLLERTSKHVPLDLALESSYDVVARLGSPNMVLLSDIVNEFEPQEKAKAAARATYKRRDVMLLNSWWDTSRRGYSGQWKNAWVRATEAQYTYAGRKLYLLYDSKTLASPGFSHSRGLRDTMKLFRDAGLLAESVSVFGVKADSAWLKDKNWVNVFDYVEAKVKRMFTPEKELELSILIKRFNPPWDVLVAHLAAKQPLAADSPLQQFAIAYTEASKLDKQKWQLFLRAVEYFEAQGKITRSGKVTDFEAAWEQAIKFYPMLQICGEPYSFRHNMETMQRVIEYLQMMEDLRDITAEVLGTEKEMVANA